MGAFTGTWYDFTGWEWSHFQPRDRVIVFGAPDPGPAVDADVVDVVLGEYLLHLSVGEGEP
jgi:hypothetical protein